MFRMAHELPEYLNPPPTSRAALAAAALAAQQLQYHPVAAVTTSTSTTGTPSLARANTDPSSLYTFDGHQSIFQQAAEQRHHNYPYHPSSPPPPYSDVVQEDEQVRQMKNLRTLGKYWLREKRTFDI